MNLRQTFNRIKNYISMNPKTRVEEDFLKDIHSTLLQSFSYFTNAIFLWGVKDITTFLIIKGSGYFSIIMAFVFAILPIFLSAKYVMSQKQYQQNHPKAAAIVGHIVTVFQYIDSLSLFFLFLVTFITVLLLFKAQTTPAVDLTLILIYGFVIIVSYIISSISLFITVAREQRTPKDVRSFSRRLSAPFFIIALGEIISGNPSLFVVLASIGLGLIFLVIAEWTR